MRIKRFQLGGHPVLGDLDLSLADEHGSVFDTIVLAGANGSGKTVMLDTI
jgi:ABC-type molybdenum transport system ATPase subunit/photorepair protein PhrA